MLKARTLNRMTPRGFKIEATEVRGPDIPLDAGGLRVVESERLYYDLHIQGFTRSGVFGDCHILISLPFPNQGVIEINGMRKFVVQEAVVDVAQYRLGEPPLYYIRNRTTVVANAIESILSKHLMDFFMTGEKPTDLAVQADIDKWFKTDPMSQDAPESKIGLESLKDLVYVRAPDNGLDLGPRQFSQQLLGIFDPASTPAGEKVNMAYRLAEGVKVVNTMPQFGTSIFCKTINRYHGPVSLSPRRTHISRAPYEHALDLEEPIPPAVGTPGPDGRDLVTAIMRFGAYVGEDAIVFSQTAAQKMRARRVITEQFPAINSIHMKVKQGDTILPGAVLAQTTSIETLEEAEIRTKKIRHPAEVTDVTAVYSRWFNVPCVKVRVRTQSIINLQNGDKVFTRGAIKGVVRVLPDNQMPTLEDGTPVDVVISPESVVGRRSMSVFWEMMANEAVKNGVPVVMDHFNPRPSMPELVQAGYGDCSQLYLHGQALPEKTFVGKMFFFRLDKLASEIVSYHKGDVTLNGMGLPADSAKAAGQKRDLAKGIAMLARGFSHTFQELCDRNMHAHFSLDELTKVLQNGTTPTPKVVADSFDQLMAGAFLG